MASIMETEGTLVLIKAKSSLPPEILLLSPMATEAGTAAWPSSSVIYCTALAETSLSEMLGGQWPTNSTSTSQR